MKEVLGGSAKPKPVLPKRDLKLFKPWHAADKRKAFVFPVKNMGHRQL